MKVEKIALIMFFLQLNIIFADNRIIMYLRHAPDAALQETERELVQSSLAKKITKMADQSPADISKKNIKYAIQAILRPHLSGFFATYGGYTDYSNTDGLISFPLRQTTPKLYIAITPNIKLVHIKGNTFSHREFITDEINTTDLYSFELKTDEKQRSFWDVKKIPLPDDKKISPLAVVILTQPKNIFVQEGKFLTESNPQLILPDNIFVIDRSSNDYAVLQMLDSRTFFEPITIEKKQISDTAAQALITNL